MYSRLLIASSVALWSVAIIAGQSGPPAPSSKPAPAPVPQTKPAPPRAVAAANTAPAGLDQAAARKLVDQYCVTCHNARLKTGGPAARSELDLARFGEHSEMGENASCASCAPGMMPPTGARRPDAETMESLIRWMETELDRDAAHAPAGPRPAPPESHRVRERDSRPARARSRRDASSCPPTTRRAASTTSPAR